jgi:hypothetical protein
MITAKRRASATITFFIPRCVAIFIAQALSQDQLPNAPTCSGPLRRSVAIAGTANAASEIFNPGTGRAIHGGLRYRM